MIRLTRITVYPIKSLDGAAREAVDYGPTGWLADDRRYAIVDADGRFVNGKRNARVHLIRVDWEGVDGGFTLSSPRLPAQDFTVFLGDEGPSQWLSDALGVACRLVERRPGGFPDDTAAPGPTLLSTPSLEAVAGWFPALTTDEARRRFRANLEFGAPAPFWEDQLVRASGDGAFRLGGAVWQATGICQRCPVPARDATTGQATTGFQKTFANRRQQTLPPWSPPARFDHFYRFAVNTRLADAQLGGTLALGDELRVDPPAG